MEPQLLLPISAQDATKIILKNVSARRMRDVLEKRFGLKGGRKKTLEAIGQEYKITRERVRQIEAEALRQIRRKENLIEVEPVFQTMEAHLADQGEVLAENDIFSQLGDPRHRPHIAFLLEVGNQFHVLSETGIEHRRWTINPETASSVERLMRQVADELAEKGSPVSESELHKIVESRARDIFGVSPNEEVRLAYLGTTKRIRQNPYGEYGLGEWPSVSPAGVKDKAYVALEKAGKPLHFKDVAEAINQAGWSKKKAHPQTVHNELIKDARFVLVGRGLYALREWGYEPGPVRDVLVSLLKQANQPLSKDAIIHAVLEKRMVKAPTILLNLQNRSLFKRTENGQYTLA